jgi:hypothetical protein
VRAFSAAVSGQGVYDVTLLLSENRHARKGLRRFTVRAEGTPSCGTSTSSLGPAGTPAHKVTVPVLVKDGRLDLSFAASAGQTEISGISIAPSSGVLTTSGRVKPALTTTTATTDGVQRISTRTSSYTDRSGKVWSASAASPADTGWTSLRRRSPAPTTTRCTAPSTGA